jgi:hypothetical protein
MMAKLTLIIISLTTNHYGSSFLVPQLRTSAISPSTTGTTTMNLYSEKKMNLKIDLESSQVETQYTLGQGEERNVESLIAITPTTKTTSSISTINDTKSGIAKERKTRVILGYKAMGLSFFALAAIQVAILTKRGSPAVEIPILISGHVMAGGVSSILVDAAKNERLGSNTYKRLNLALVGYGLIGLPIVTMMANPQLIAYFLLSVINSSKGYGFGVLGWDQKSSDTGIMKDLINGTKSTIKSIFSVPKHIKSFGYSTAITFTAKLIISNVIVLKGLIQASASGPKIAKHLTLIARMCFATVIFFTLKDASDHNRLGDTTSIELNVLSALVMGALAGFTSGAGIPGEAPTLLTATFALFCAFNGLSSYLERNAV